MFQFQTNADGSFKAFTFTPCDTALFPSGIRCYKNNEFQQYPLMLKRSYISKIDIKQSYLSKVEGHTFCIIITDGSNDVYTFEFRKIDFCCESTVQDAPSGCESNVIASKQHLEFLIQTLFNDNSLSLIINKLGIGSYDVLIGRS